MILLLTSDFECNAIDFPNTPSDLFEKKNLVQKDYDFLWNATAYYTPIIPHIIAIQRHVCPP